MNKKKSIFLIAALILILGISLCLFTVEQTQQAIVIQLGKPVGGVSKAGLHFKVPFIQQVQYFENRIVLYDATPTEILTRDKKNLLVDNYTKWRIEDPLKFYKTVRTEAGAQARLDDIVYAQLRVELGQHDLSDIVSTTRNDIMAKVTEASAVRAKAYGIKVVDVRIKRADLPEQNEKHVFDRMRAERERQARQYRSEGEEESKKITAKADMERTIILAKANKESEQLKGEGDSEAIRIYAQAYEKDAEFYEFIRSLEAYKKALNGKTKVIFTPDIKFFEHMK
ncbi:MAG: protease modulator HflC [Syntrophales bacterium]|jgi:membrane protease subunit HflC|nr:protease modulator HflC [Syntrophales bacterium]MDY0045568.1 protease modulator HflC [Syntrophales bacterium]